ncbi:MAG: phytanoyl-CoA dioxygenase family protein [Pseudomonadales bacterium]
MSVDFRSRKDTDTVEPIVPSQFFSQTLAAALNTHAQLLAPGISYLAVPPFSFDIDGEVWTLVCDGDRVNIIAGDISGASKTRLSQQDFDGLIRDWFTPITFFVGGTLDMQAGSLDDFINCWLILRAALDGRAIYTPGTIDFKDRHGEPLDLNSNFTLEDDPEDISHFLHEAGYLHLRGMFSEAEMAQISADMDAAAPGYFDGDGKSWWAETADGTNHLVRMQYFQKHSAITDRLLKDPRLLAIGDITGDAHQHYGLGENAIEALIKPLNIVKGISDLPWHKDCSLGRHSYDCCKLTVGISVTGADADSGQLRVVAGSHRALMWPSLISPGSHDLPEIDLPTATGDVTVHLSCTMHMAQAPKDKERRVMYTGFELPVEDRIAAAKSVDRISVVREGAYKTVSQ